MLIRYTRRELKSNFGIHVKTAEIINKEKYQHIIATDGGYGTVSFFRPPNFNEYRKIGQISDKTFWGKIKK